MDADLDTLATALYVFTDDLLRDHPERVPPRPRGGITPKLSDAELLTVAVLQALLGFTSEHRWIRWARAYLHPMFPQLPASARLQQAAPSELADTMAWLVTRLGAATWIADDTCGWSTRPRSSAAAPARPSSAPTWPAGPSTATAPPTPGSSGGCGCIWSAPCTVCPSAGR